MSAPLFEVEDLHVAVERHRDPQGRRPGRRRGRGPRPDGPQRVGQVDPGQHPARQPGLPGDRRAGSCSRARTSPTWPTDVRAKAGIFLAFQYPEEIPGVPMVQFLRQALSARKGIDLSVLELRLAIMEWMKRLDMDPSFGDRYLNEGFSGGEKKRNEILQMAILEPELAILDETDSGLDIDALRAVARGVQRGAPARPGARRPAHHPLPAHPGRAGARRGAPPRRRPDRRQRRPGAGPPARGGGIRGMALDVELVKKDFPILDQQVHGHRLVYLDSAASSQKPLAVLDAMQRLYETTYANVHRGVYTIAEEATRLYEEARGQGGRASSAAGSAREVVFTKNVTEAINLVAYSWGRANLRAGDVVVLTEMEHHANLVPWLQLKAERGIELRYLPVDRRRAARPRRPRPSCSTGPSWSASPPCPTCSAPSTRSAGSPTRPTPPAPWSSSTAPSTPRISPTDVGRPGLRLLRLHRPQDARARPASAACGPGRSCSRRCRPSSAAAR